MNFSGYVGHATIFGRMFTIMCSLVVGIWLGLDLMFGCAHVFVLLCTFNCHCHTVISLRYTTSDSCVKKLQGDYTQ